MKGDRIRALLGGTELRPLFDAVRDALEARGPEQARTVTLTGLAPAERRAIADLHGWPEVPAGERVRISLARLEEALRGSAVASGVAEVLTALGGELVDRRRTRADAEAERERVWSRAAGHEAVRARPELARWLTEVRAHGLAARAASAAGTTEAAVLERALAVVARLPADGVLLAVLATEVLGDAHALDGGRVETSLVLRAAAVIGGWSGVPSSAADRRRLWADVGVACDPLSADALTLGLAPPGDGLLVRHLRELASAGEPRRITLRELTRQRVSVEPDTEVFVCENPSVVAAAADRLGSGCAPLVCVEGVPSSAALRLLGALAGSGAVLRFHSDFDWGGIRIANLLAAEFPSARPWRMGTLDYESAITRGGDLLELTGAAVAAKWDESLAPTLSRHRIGVPEERVLEDLLADLDKRGAAAF
jgi:uncharacterized protein (TIGR02679 family)